MKYRVTARWINCSFKTERNNLTDIIELNNSTYFLCQENLTNKEIENWMNNNPLNNFTANSITEIEDSGDIYGILFIIKNRNPDWIYVSPQCECGAEKVKTTHATWCPKYEEC